MRRRLAVSLTLAILLLAASYVTTKWSRNHALCGVFKTERAKQVKQWLDEFDFELFDTGSRAWMSDARREHGEMQDLQAWLQEGKRIHGLKIELGHLLGREPPDQDAVKVAFVMFMLADENDREVLLRTLSLTNRPAAVQYWCRGALERLGTINCRPSESRVAE